MEKSTTDNQAADSVEEITVIGADTVVAVDGCVLGKPKTEDEAKQMLARLSGRTHDVFTGVCILWTDSDTQEEIHGNTFHCHTKVTFYPMTEEEIATMSLRVTVWTRQVPMVSRAEPRSISRASKAIT